VLKRVAAHLHIIEFLPNPLYFAAILRRLRAPLLRLERRAHGNQLLQLRSHRRFSVRSLRRVATWLTHREPDLQRRRRQRQAVDDDFVLLLVRSSQTAGDCRSRASSLPRDMRRASRYKR